MTILGHDAAKAQFAKALSSGRMPHAWMLCGPKGIGKAALAWEMARMLLAGTKDPQSPAAIRMEAGTHGDFLLIDSEVLTKGKGEINVETVREVMEFAHSTPAEGERRVVLIDGADRMNRQAANALLKTLEEPPASMVLLLVTHRAGLLPATIRSRCRLLRLLTPLEVESRMILAGALPQLTEGERGKLLDMADGVPGLAYSLHNAGGMEIAETIRRFFDALPSPRPDLLWELSGIAATGDHQSAALFDHLLKRESQERVKAAIAQKDPHVKFWIKLHEHIRFKLGEIERFALDRKHALLTMWSMA